MVLGPTGTAVGDALCQDEAILYADIDLAQSVEPKQFHDVVGSYNRFDIFTLSVDRSTRRPATFIDQPRDSAASEIPPDCDSALFDPSRVPRTAGNPMKDTQFPVEHIHVATDKRYEDVANAFEIHLGQFDAQLHDAIARGDDAEELKTTISAMAGPSGFVLFGTTDHGSLLRITGQKRKAVQYVVGNPLFAIQMTQRDIRASLYAPLRVLLYENEDGMACLEYDKPSSLFAQFGNAEIGAVAAMLDTKLEALVSAAVR